MLKYLFVFTTVLIFLTSNFAWSGGKEYRESLGGSTSNEPFDNEFRYLPSFCACLKRDDIRYKQKCKKAIKKFEAYGDRGASHIHMHHYCGGLLMLSRLKRGVGERSALLKTAEGEFGYVIRHSSQNFILMPEILMNMGKTQKLMGNDVEAIRNFFEAIKLKRNYTPAYLHLANVYMEKNDYANALKTVKMGLKYSPDEPRLKQILGQLQQQNDTKKP